MNGKKKPEKQPEKKGRKKKADTIPAAGAGGLGADPGRTEPDKQKKAPLAPANLMDQYREARERHPGMLVLFRLGDFYELFDDQAETASKLLGLTLTTRDKTTPMAGFPAHALETHLRKLLQAGHRVAIADQIDEVPPNRQVNRVVTPGSMVEGPYGERV